MQSPNLKVCQFVSAQNSVELRAKLRATSMLKTKYTSQNFSFIL